MKTLSICIIILLSGPFLYSQSSKDSLAIEKAARDYVEGWQAGDAERVMNAVSPELKKRVVIKDKEGNYFISDMSASLLVYATRNNKEGVRVPDKQPEEAFMLYVDILDISGNVASVKAWNTKYGFLDYCHLARFGEEWKIVNVLWDWLPEE
nr:nuclear transport factor 2 family protein [Bacteroidota bacterium]